MEGIFTPTVSSAPLIGGCVEQAKLHLILETINFYRGLVLDSVEQEFGEHPKWPALRARLLRAFGDRGLANRIQEILGGGK